MNRTDGYTTDVSYPAFFYKEMQPVWLSSVTHFLGFAAPDVSAAFALCELGCGVGVNLLAAAACHPNAAFVGVDFNEEHLKIARDAARSCNLRNIQFIHSDFAEFSANNQRKFDFVTTHGVWSWIAPTHQASLLTCAAGALKPEGLFYLHYMCHPGSTGLVNIQYFLNLFSHHIPGTSVRRIEAGLDLLRQLAGRGLFSDQPEALKHIQNLSRLDPHHLAHEFLTDHWRPQHAVDVHGQVGEAGLAYLGSADVFGNLDPSLSIPGKLQGVIRQTKAPALAETLKDMARNSHQRMDIFQKAPKPLKREAYLAHLGDMKFMLLPGAPDRGPRAFSTPIGEIEAPEGVVAALLQGLSSGPASFAKLVRLPPLSAEPDLLLQTLQLLMHQDIVHPTTPAPAPENVRARELTQWFARNGVSLKIVEDCGTAVRTTAP